MIKNNSTNIVMVKMFSAADSTIPDFIPKGLPDVVLVTTM